MSEDAMRLVLHLILSGAALGVLPGCGDSAREAQPTAPDRPPVVVALGDSLTAGFGLAPDEAYPALLQSRIERANYPHRVINAGVSGDTSAGALRRLDSVLHADTRVLILAIGANDGLQGVPIAELRGNLTAIIERARSRSIQVLLCGMETPPTRGFDYSLAFHGLFPELAARYQTPLMPFLLEGVVGDPALNLPDRFHPNAAGYRRIAERMWPYLEPLVRATS